MKNKFKESELLVEKQNKPARSLYSLKNISLKPLLDYLWHKLCVENKKIRMKNQNTHDNKIPPHFQRSEHICFYFYAQLKVIVT